MFCFFNYMFNIVLILNKQKEFKMYGKFINQYIFQLAKARKHTLIMVSPILTRMYGINCDCFTPNYDLSKILQSKCPFV